MSPKVKKALSYLALSIICQYPRLLEIALNDFEQIKFCETIVKYQGDLQHRAKDTCQHKFSALGKNNTKQQLLQNLEENEGLKLSFNQQMREF